MNDRSFPDKRWYPTWNAYGEAIGYYCQYGERPEGHELPWFVQGSSGKGSPYEDKPPEYVPPSEEELAKWAEEDRQAEKRAQMMLYAAREAHQRSRRRRKRG